MTVQLYMKTVDVDQFPSHSVRTNTDLELEELEIDMYANGMKEPIRLEKTNQGWTILDGVRRLMVAKKMRMEFVPVTFELTLTLNKVIEL